MSKHLELVEAIADGNAVDWNEALDSAESEDARKSIETLRNLSRIVDAHWALQPPQRWCRLEILEKVGEGGFAEVFRAHDERLQRNFALKLVRSSDRILEEGRQLARVDHPNVARVYGSDEEDGRAGIWMEFIEGQNLREVLRENGPLTTTEVGEIGLDVARALSAIHEQGLVHGDIKAQNIMRERGGRIVVMDFGIRAGTPIYMAPELLEGASPTPQSDIYAVGVLLYYLVSGSFPVEGRDVDDLRSAHRTGSCRRLIDLRPELPTAFVESIEKALMHEPDARFQTVGELESSLRAVIRPAGFSSWLESLWEDRIARMTLTFSGLASAALLVPFLAWLVGVSADVCSSVSTSMFAGAVLAAAVSGIQRKRLDLRDGAVLLSVYLGAAGLLFSVVSPVSVLPDRASVQNEDFVPWRVNVAVFENWTEDDELARIPYIVQDAIQYQIDQSRFLRAIEPIETDEDPSVDDTRISVRGNVFRAGSTVRLTAKLHDLEDGVVTTETVEMLAPSDGFSEQRMLNAAAQIASKVRVQLEIQASGSASDAGEIRRLKTLSVDAYKRFVDGREKYQSRRTDEAIAALKEALAIDPAFVHAHVLLSDAYYSKGDHALALETLNSALQYPERLGKEESLRWRLREARIEERWSAYAALLDEALVSESWDAEWRFTSGWYHVTHSRNYDQGISDLQNAIRRDPSREAYFLNHLTYAYLHAGDSEKALESAMRFAELDSSAYAQDCLGETLLLLGHYEQAQEVLERVARAEPDFLHVQKHLGQLYYAIGQPEKAIAALKQYELDREEQYDAWLLQATTLLREGRNEEARDAIAKASYPDFRIIRTWWLKGILAIRSNDLEQARDSLRLMEEEVLDRGTNFGAEFFHHLRANVYLEEGLVDLAIDELRKAVSLGPLERCFFLTELGNVQLDNGRLDEALATYRRALELNPFYAEAHVRLGEIYERRRMFDRAATHYQAAVDVWRNAEPDFRWNGVASTALERVQSAK